MFTLPDLGYSFGALEPYIDAKTMEIHHDKHHGTYVSKLNDALKDQKDLQDKNIEELLRSIDSLPGKITQAVRNNGGGHHNHTLFWGCMTPGGPSEPTGKLADAINFTFGSFDEFKQQLADVAVGRFGSGWTWLVGKGGKLEIYSTPNQDSPIMDGNIPILGLDVWEHAYYLKYQNRRPDYIEAWWNVVNWDIVSSRFK